MARREPLAWAAGIATLLFSRASLADHYQVPSGSMRPTIEVGDHVVVNKLAYGLRVPLSHVHLLRLESPSRGDVVVLDSPDDGTVLLKRVVAIPGDRVSVRHGEVELDGQRAPRAYAVRREDEGGPDFGPVTLPPDSYLVLGDNRGDSRDGRYFGLVARSAILGRAVAVVGRRGDPVWAPL
ncbi:MAG: signal peptidase I [Myxococcales bacterium]|nr:signal peptidase I [Myxococcales bacterium]